MKTNITGCNCTTKDSESSHHLTFVNINLYFDRWNIKAALILCGTLPLTFSALTLRGNSGSRFPASSGGSPLRHGREVDTERTQRTQPVHGDCPRDRTHSGTGALPGPSRSNVAVLQETRPQPGAELGRHLCSAAAVRWEDGAFYGDPFNPMDPVCGFSVTNSCCLDSHCSFNVLL